MSLEGQRLGMAIAEENARHQAQVMRVADATFTCVVSANNIELMGKAAFHACVAYFGKQAFQIESLDAEQTPAARIRVGETYETEEIAPSYSYTAIVRARAV